MKTWGIPDSARDKGVYIAGKPGQGKSTIMYWLALQDIHRKKAVCVLDPNGDLVEQLLVHIPEERKDDVIYLDGLESIPLDFMAWETDLEKTILCDDLISMFKRLAEGDWSDPMDSVMTHAVLAILETRRTFLDIERMLSFEKYREETVLPAVRDERVLNFWENRFKSLPRTSADAIISRFSKYVTQPALRATLDHLEPKLHIPTTLATNHILLVNLHKIGERAGNVYGSLLTAQIQQAIFKRAKNQRKPTSLFIDEFQDFAGASFKKILSQGRKFNLSLTLGNQFPSQLGDLIDHITGCVSTFILFKMNATHAAPLRSEVLPYKPEDLVKLPEFHALYAAIDGSVQFINTYHPPPDPTKEELKRAEYIRKRTLDKYACETPPKPHNYAYGGAKRSTESKPDPQPQKLHKALPPNASKAAGH